MNHKQYSAVKVAQRRLKASIAHLLWSIQDSYCEEMHKHEQAQLREEEDALYEINELLEFWERNNA